MVLVNSAMCLRQCSVIISKIIIISHSHSLTSPLPITFARFALSWPQISGPQLLSETLRHSVSWLCPFASHFVICTKTVVGTIYLIKRLWSLSRSGDTVYVCWCELCGYVTTLRTRRGARAERVTAKTCVYRSCKPICRWTCIYYRRL